MSPHRTFPVYGVITTAVMLLLVFTPIAVCQTVAVEEPESKQPDTIEEVMVYGTSLKRLEAKVYRTEEKLFDTFNSLNDDDQYDVHCGYRQRTRSRIRQWFCTPNYLKKVRRDAARGFFEGLAYNSNMGTVLLKEQHLLEKMQELVAQHPELREVRDELVIAKYKLALERKSRKK
ncbi:MAG: hypothetical protein OEU84_13455 [Xanthomonadales bacterium]|nr:hypothetical protein [Xanthomonadales bacterium]